MDDIIIRSKYPRSNTMSRKRRRNAWYRNSLQGNVVRQVFATAIILAAIVLVKNVNIPLTNFISDSIRNILVENVELKSMYDSLNGVLDLLMGKGASSRSGEEPASIPASAGADQPQTQEAGTGEASQASGGATRQDAAVSGEEQQAQDDPKSDGQKVQEDAAKTDVNSETTSQDSSIADEIRKKYSFIVPVSGYLGSAYGMRVDPLEKVEKFHKGVDIEANKGAAIKAALGGEVVEASTSPTYGKYIKIQHGDGIVTVYAHCSQLLVKKGQKVQKGAEIAKVGDTGAAVGAHLHFEIWKDGEAIDPASLIKIPVKDTTG
ncbi:MAG: M23 family metallopeptidase [Clostridiales bacterium]|jgi:murein DD-endopeptidase MepM/ murein hydrolase activator NlpD|nr:M23 family metallopeptidase [Eubacteriales bacterium]MDH7566396.1 M23 family metallopeptidase [Clostridiales bacterium]